MAALSEIAQIYAEADARIMKELGCDTVMTALRLRDLVAGCGLSFQDRGIHELKGLPQACISTVCVSCKHVEDTRSNGGLPP